MSDEQYAPNLSNPFNLPKSEQELIEVNIQDIIDSIEKFIDYCVRNNATQDYVNYARHSLETIVLSEETKIDTKKSKFTNLKAEYISDILRSRIFEIFPFPNINIQTYVDLQINKPSIDSLSDDEYTTIRLKLEKLEVLIKNQILDQFFDSTSNVNIIKAQLIKFIKVISFLHNLPRKTDEDLIKNYKSIDTLMEYFDFQIPVTITMIKMRYLFGLTPENIYNLETLKKQYLMLMTIYFYFESYKMLSNPES